MVAPLLFRPPGSAPTPQSQRTTLAYSLTKLVVLLTTAVPHLLHSVGASPITFWASNPSFRQQDNDYVDGVGVGVMNDGGVGAKHGKNDPDTQPGTPEFWWKCVLIVVLVLLGGVFAGLTLGLMGLDAINLKVLETSGSEIERKQARKVLKLLERGKHWVLVVLLLSNVVVNETLPIFLDSVIGGGVGAIVISTALIVIFGEIIPQSICVRNGLSIGSKCTPFVLALMYIEFPIAYPIAMLLDKVLGQEKGVTYKKAELKTFVGLHRESGEETLNEDEVTIISAVLELSEKKVKDIMTPINDIYTLSTDQVLDEKTVDEILKEGYSRVPVHEAGHPENFVGLLLVKKLIPYDPEDHSPVSSFQLATLFETGPNTTCLDALNWFQQGRSHLLLVSSKPGEHGGALGLVSLEDVIEEMIGEEIVDESDRYVDVKNRIRVVRRQPGQISGPTSFGPLVQRVSQRRKQARQEEEAAALKVSTTADQNGGDYGSTAPSASPPVLEAIAEAPALDKKRAANKIKVKGPTGPETANPTTVVPSGSGPPQANSSREQGGDEERRPLLGPSKKSTK